MIEFPKHDQNRQLHIIMVNRSLVSATSDETQDINKGKRFAQQR